MKKIRFANLERINFNVARVELGLTYEYIHICLFVHSSAVYNERCSRNRIMHVFCSGYQYCFIVARGATKSEVKADGVHNRSRGDEKSCRGLYCFISVQARAPTFRVIRSSPASIASPTGTNEHV